MISGNSNLGTSSYAPHASISGGGMGSSGMGHSLGNSSTMSSVNSLGGGCGGGLNLAGGGRKERKSISIDHLFSNGSSNGASNASSASSATRPNASNAHSAGHGSGSSNIPQHSAVQNLRNAPTQRESSSPVPAMQPLPLSKAEIDDAEGDFLSRLRRVDDDGLSGNLDRFKFGRQ
jgi:hypothetical protein